MKEMVVYCTKCGEAHLYNPQNTKQKNPRIYCKSCKYQFPVGKYLKSTSKKSNFDPPQITPTPERENMSPSPILAAMTLSLIHI